MSPAEAKALREAVEKDGGEHKSQLTLFLNKADDKGENRITCPASYPSPESQITKFESKCAWFTPEADKNIRLVTEALVALPRA